MLQAIQVLHAGCFHGLQIIQGYFGHFLVHRFLSLCRAMLFGFDPQDSSLLKCEVVLARDLLALRPLAYFSPSDLLFGFGFAIGCFPTHFSSLIIILKLSTNYSNMNHPQNHVHVKVHQPYVYRGRDVLQTIQTPTSNPNFMQIHSSTIIRQQVVPQVKQPTTSHTLDSYRTTSPSKGLDIQSENLNSLKRLVEVAIQNKWTKQTLNTHWQEFVTATKSYDSKYYVEEFFKYVTWKPKVRKVKSQPKRHHKVNESPPKAERFQDKYDFQLDYHKPPAFHRQLSYNYDPYPKKQKVNKQLTKSKSDHFKKVGSKLQNAQANKPTLSKQAKLLKLCEMIQAGFAKGHKVMVTKGMPF